MGYKDKEKQREFNRAWMKRRRDEWFATHGPCVKCQSNDRLQIDHVDPTQKTSHRVWSWAEERRTQELAKCQVLCYICHLTKTLEQRPKAQHGASQMANTHGCPCKLCREYIARKSARARLRRKLGD